MVEKVTGGKALPKEIVQQIVSKTDGVPLFVEELTKSVIESVGALREAPLHVGIPATLQDALTARLDRLGTAKEIAQVGATIGREFTYDLLQAVSPLNEETLQRGLRQLVEVELVYQSGVPPQARYLFKHALVQETAYQSLLKSRRQQLHHQVAQVLEERFSEVKETQPELLAHHYTEAGLLEQAIPYWQRAGEQAAQRSAYVEAISHLTKGIELLKTLPDTPEHTQQELTLQLALGGPLIMTKGFAAPEVETTYTRAQEFCRQVGETPQLFAVLGGLASFYLVRAEYKTSHKLRSQRLTFAQRLQDPPLLLQAHQGLGSCLFMCGEFVAALEHFDQAIALYNPQQHRFLAFPKVYSQGLGAWALLALGYSDQAQKRNDEALTLGRELPSPFERAYTLFHTAMFHLCRREGLAAQKLSEKAMTLATELGFSMMLAWVTITRGWALVEQGEGEEGLAQMRQGLAAFRATGAELGRPTWLGAMAEACGKVGQVEEGLSLLAEALAAVHKTGECLSEAELYRVKGSLTLRSKVQGQKSQVCDEAEASFQQAIEVARRQSAKYWELRASTSLARLWQTQGKQEEAHKMLAEIYGWFTEGFDTKDLQEAKALLEELSH
jgi:predicted ATPase